MRNKGDIREARGKAIQTLKDIVSGKPIERGVRAKMSLELHKFLRRNVAKGLRLGKTAEEIIEFYRKDKIVMRFAQSDGYTEETFAQAINEMVDEVKNSPTPEVVKTQKVGRNEPCPCGSGKKYKRCCGR